MLPPPLPAYYLLPAFIVIYLMLMMPPPFAIKMPPPMLSFFRRFPFAVYALIFMLFSLILRHAYAALPVVLPCQSRPSMSPLLYAAHADASHATPYAAVTNRGLPLDTALTSFRYADAASPPPARLIIEPGRISRHVAATC